jgi:inosose dehydratase
MRIANAPCSWGLLEFDLQGEVAGYAQVLDEIRETGYAGTELGDWGFMPIEPDRLREELTARGLDLVGAFVPVDLLNGGAEGETRALRTARLLASTAGDAPLIVLSGDNGKDPLRTKLAGRIRPEHGLKDEQWAIVAEVAQRIARRVREETGLRTVFHHHCAGYVETPQEVERLMSLTDPSLIGLCLDTGHYRFGGGDPVAAALKHGDRIWHLHFKDCDPEVAARSRAQGWDYFRSVREGVFCELGRGDVDFPGVVAELQRQRYDGWIVVEQDVLPGMGDPKASAQRNHDYLRSIGV